MKRVNQSEHSVTFHGIELRPYTLFGRVNGTWYYCEKPRARRSDRRVNGSPAFILEVWSDANECFEWHTSQDFPAIHDALRDFISAAKLKRPPKDEKATAEEIDAFMRGETKSLIKPRVDMRTKSEKAAQEARREAREKCIPGAPTGEMRSRQFNVSPGSQARVDGKGYNLEIEERVFDLENYSGYPVEYETYSAPMRRAETVTDTGRGLKVEYKDEEPTERRKIALNAFDGVDKNHDDWHRDGMKVNQIKARPERTKKYSYNAPAKREESFAESLRRMSTGRVEYLAANLPEGAKLNAVKKELVARN